MPASTDEPDQGPGADARTRSKVRLRVSRFARRHGECCGPGVADVADLQRAGLLVAQAQHGDASLLWTGDKRVFFSGGGNAFLMFQLCGRSWVVMGDPIGAPEEFDDLLSRFIAECDRHSGRPVFYCVREHNAERYRRVGLRLLKLGEEAVVDLDGFSMQASHRAKLRSEVRAAVKLGCEVEVLDPENVRPVLAELREVSDAWLAARRVKEKSFSLGTFDEEYVARFPVAVTRQHGKIIAFASLWASGGHGEVKVDLMRRRSDTPRTVMSQLFVESMLWAQKHNYSSFSLGMAPLSGLCTEDAAPFWERVGHFLHSYGESFYNFRGLRQFKVRFKPDWQPRYIASRGGPTMPVTILNVICLVGGGLRGVVPVAAVNRPGKKKPESEQTIAASPPETALVGARL
ncbi:MAG: phosphatidylglycerol lysyltransferase domain-containing protein [Herbaspirillum sp.]